MKIEDVKIDPEFKALIDDGHTVQQIEGLLEDIKFRGFRDDLVVWKEESILLDGHTRHNLWEQHFKGKSTTCPKVSLESFATRKEAKRWVILNQISRRNLNQTRAAYYRGMLHNELKLDDEQNLNRGQNPPVRQNDVPEESSGKSHKTTAETVAEQTGVSPRTVQRDAVFAAAVDRIAIVNGKAATDIKDGKLADKKTAIAIAKLNDTNIGIAIGNLRNGRPWDDRLDEAIGVAAGTRRPAKPPKKKPKRAQSSPELKKLDQAVGAVSRALVAAAKVRGEGAHYRSIFESIKKIKKTIAEWMTA